MMDAGSSAHGHQKASYNAYLHTDRPPHSLDPPRAHTPSLQEIFDMNGLNMQQNPSGVAMDVLDNLMSNSSSSAAGPASLPAPGSQPAQQMLMEQQMRLNQLQQLYQLQTQIFQQQIELLSGQTSFNSLPLSMMVDPARSRDQQYLPTPTTSGDLPPQPSPDFVPPMMLHPGSSSQTTSQSNPFNQAQPGSFMQNHQLQSPLVNAQGQQHNQSGMIPPTPHSAPANIVFQNIPGHLGGGGGSNMNSPYGPLPSPAELEFEEMSPLTSPWLGAYNPSSAPGNISSNASQGHNATGMTDINVMPSATTGMKRRTRTSSPNSDDGPATRGRTTKKRQAALPRITPSNAAPPSRKSATNALRGGTKSANSTPIFPATNTPSSLPPNRPSTRRSTGGPGTDVPGDSPSPVDLSMPPPATPTPTHQVQMDYILNSSIISNANAASDQPIEQQEQPITPVTPAIIMNLGRLGTHSSLAPPASKSAKGPSSRSRSSTLGATVNTERTPLVSPGLKPIRPANNPAGGLRGSMPPAAASGPSSAGSAQSQQPPLHVRKTSHKAAEQKRRDSLKTSFDDLRILLPPIPLPSEEGFPDEPILPGAMPPRGPPKGNIDGPNRGVSKLQLLRCGNDYIRRLKGRVERRDVELDTLRKEINRLRLVIGVEAEDPQREDIELDKDLDACEASLGPLGRGLNGLGDNDEGDDDGAD